MTPDLIQDAYIHNPVRYRAFTAKGLCNLTQTRPVTAQDAQSLVTRLTPQLQEGVVLMTCRVRVLFTHNRLLDTELSLPVTEDTAAKLQVGQPLPDLAMDELLARLTGLAYLLSDGYALLVLRQAIPLTDTVPGNDLRLGDLPEGQITLPEILQPA